MFNHQLIAPSDDSKPIFRCHKSAWQDWHEAAEPRWKNWIDSHGFTPSHHKIISLPDSDYSLEAMLQTDSGNAFDDGAYAAKMPAGPF